jgi:hypothetical protein
MIGFPNPLAVLALLIVFVAVPSAIVTLLVLGVLAYRRRLLLRGHCFIGSALSLSAIGWLAVGQIFPAPRDIELTADLTTSQSIGDTADPTERRTLANGVIQRFYSGNVTVSITLPDGRILAGHSGHVTVYDAKGRFAGVSLFITPSQGHPEFLAYWSEGGTVLTRSEHNDQITIQRAGYRVFYEAPTGPTPAMMDIRAGDYADVDSPFLMNYETTPR